MTFLTDLSWRVPCSERDQFIEYVEDEYGDTKLYAGIEATSAMREWIDADRGSGTEEIIDRIVQVEGSRPQADDEKRNKLSSDTLANEEKVRVRWGVHPPTKEAFAAHCKKHADDPMGVMFAYALREYRQGGRWDRVEDKLIRISEDIEGLLTAVLDSPGGASPQEQRTVAMCRQIHDLPLTVGVQPIPRRDIHAAIESVMGSLSDYLKETYTPLILDRIEYEPSPSNANLFLPVGDAEQQRREDAASDAHQQMDVLSQAIPATDGGTSH